MLSSLMHKKSVEYVKARNYSLVLKPLNFELGFKDNDFGYLSGGHSCAHLGYKIRGVKGSIAATIGSVLPSFMIILAIAMAFTSFKDNPVVISIFKGIRPVVVSLIAVPTISMAKKSCKTWWAWVIAIASLLLVSFLEVSPIYIIMSVIVLGLAAAKLSEGRKS